jgi:hypothetical protein
MCFKLFMVSLRMCFKMFMVFCDLQNEQDSTVLFYGFVVYGCVVYVW